MFLEIPQNLIWMTIGAFLVGWLLSSISGAIGAKFKARKCDPRDDRIRSLEAELRVTRTDLDSSRDMVDRLEKELEEANDGIEKRDNVITRQQGRLEETTIDLKGSVRKTRELRSELSDRATENIKSEVKLREVETELEVAQASTDMIATGVLDYSVAPDAEEGAKDGKDLPGQSDMSKVAT